MLMPKRSERTEAWLAVELIALVWVLYGLLWPRLGMYWDDWLFMWLAHSGGTEVVSAHHAFHNRQFCGVILNGAYWLFGTNLLAWQIGALGVRLLTSLLIWLGFRRLWPGREHAATAAALLYLIYPGNLLSFSVVSLFYNAYSCLAIFSIVAMIAADSALTRRSYWLLTVPAMAACLAYLFSQEYYIAYEGVRIAILVYLAAEARNRLAYVVKRYIPYLVITGPYVVWRLFFLENPRPAADTGQVVSSYLNQPGILLARLASLVSDLFETALFAWFAPAYRFLFENPKYFFLQLLLGLIGLFVVLVYYRLAWREDESVPDKAPAWGGGVFILGVVAALLALAPVAWGLRQFSLFSTNARFGLVAALAVAITAVGAIYFIARPRLRPWLVGVLVGLALMAHFGNNVRLMYDWQYQKDLWRQISWRAPQLKPGTLVILASARDISDKIRRSGMAVLGPAEIIYGQPAAGKRIGGFILDQFQAQRLADGFKGEAGPPRFSFPVDYSKSLVFLGPTESSCLRLLDSRRWELPPGRSYGSPDRPLCPGLIREVGAFSRVGQIEAGGPAAELPAGIFGPEPGCGWCYYFQKMDLARQEGDWPRVAELAAEAQKKGLAPGDATEWLPLVEAQAHLGRLTEVNSLTGLILSAGEEMRPVLAGLAARLSGAGLDGAAGAVLSALQGTKP